MALQVERGEETLAPTEADETRQQPEKSRCLRVYPRARTRRAICANLNCARECSFFLCVCVRVVCACAYLPAKDLAFFVFHVRRLSLGDSISHRGGMSWKTKLRRLNISSKYFVSAYLAKFTSKINYCLICSHGKMSARVLVRIPAHKHFHLTVTWRPKAAWTSGRDWVHHLEIQIGAVKVQNPSKCLLKLYECSLCPDQNKTWWQVPVYDIPLFISESPQFPPTEREKAERRGGRAGDLKCV